MVHLVRNAGYVAKSASKFNHFQIDDSDAASSVVTAMWVHPIECLLCSPVETPDNV